MNSTTNVGRRFGNDRIAVTVYDDKNKPFTVRNRRYKNVDSLQNGFLVLHMWERFPCFDESDYLYESRYYHWFFICGSLSKYFEIKKQLRSQEIPLRQFYDTTILSTWEKYYRGLGVPVVYCEDDRDTLIVVENA